MKFPQPPKELVQKGSNIKIRKVDLFAYACIECAFRYHRSENEAKIYSGVKQLHGLRYRAQKVYEKIYFFDEEILDQYVQEVGKDFKNFLLALRVKKPFVALCGPNPEVTMSIAQALLKAKPGVMLYPYMGWEALFKEYTGFDLKELGIPANSRTNFSSAMLNLAKRFNYHARIYRALDTTLPKKGFAVFTGIRFELESNWALSRGATLFNIKAPGGKYTTDEKLLGAVPQEQAMASFTINDEQSEKQATQYILDLFKRAKFLESLQEW